MTVRVALVGAGHAHLAVLAQASRLRAAGVELILISPPSFDYSGLITGVLSGALPPESARIDVVALARKHDVPHFTSEVVAVDRAARRLTLSDGSIQACDAVSFNIGSRVDDAEALTGLANVWPVKPLASLMALRLTLEATFNAGAPTPAIVVAGDGPTGFEIAAALTGLHERHGRTVKLVLAGPDIQARWAPGQAGCGLIANLERRGVKRVAGVIATLDEDRVRLSDGGQLACDHLVLATGLRAPPLTRTMGLALDDVGRIKVAPTLASLEDDRVFAVGDCATIQGWPRPFAGVFGVRAVDILVANLRALETGAPARQYRPQDRWLSIMDLGDGSGLAMRGGLWWQGRASLALKRRLDLGFVARSRA